MKKRLGSLAAVLAVPLVLWSAQSHAEGPPTEQVLPIKAKTTLTAGKRYTFAFSLWDNGIVGVGSKVWGDEEKSYVVPASKTIAHLLGSILPLSEPVIAGALPADFADQLWVQVAAGKFVRRYKLTAVPYSLWSATADALGIECATGQILVVDGDGEWACGSLQVCTAGDLLDCYTGTPATRGVGACRDGRRSCVSGAWSGTCSGQVLPGTEVCDGIDNDCDGLVDAPACPEICDDGVDNNQNGLTDCEEAGCAGTPGCLVPEICNDGTDNDGDGFTDCLDFDCSGSPACPN